MDSFFFNITNQGYKITKIFENRKNHITRVDISNGLVFFDLFLEYHNEKKFYIKNLDRMVVISIVKNGSFTIIDNKTKKIESSKTGSSDIYCSTRQDFQLILKDSDKTEIFVLFIADFFFKRYLSSNKDEPIDFLYNKIQNELSLQLINSQPIDALTLYLIDKIINTKINTHSMSTIIGEHRVIEFMIHRLSMLDMIDNSIDKEDRVIAIRAKRHLLKNFVNPPTIKTLAHLCATNESKLKIVFKKVYKITTHSYIQKLRLKEANILLKEQILTVGEISKKVGYRHQGYFSSIFFKTYGVYPKDLLKK